MPAANASGTATLTVIVSDGHAVNGSVTQSFTVTITATNDLPVISDILNLVTPEDVSIVAGFIVSDIETPASTLTLSATSTDTTVVPVSNIVFGGSGANRGVTITPADNRSGSSTITIMVTDADGGTASDSFLLTVTAENDPPTLTGIADQVINEDESTSPLAFTIADAENAFALYWNKSRAI